MQPDHQAIKSANVSININALSPKQLLGQCIDIATQMFKQLIIHYIQEHSTPNNKIQNPLSNGQRPDFSILINYILDPSKTDSILEKYVGNQEISSKAIIKTWIFEMRNLRNCWAHSNAIDMRLALRGFQTLSLLFQAFGGSEGSEVYQRIELYRKTLLLAMAQKILSS